MFANPDIGQFFETGERPDPRKNYKGYDLSETLDEDVAAKIVKDLDKFVGSALSPIGEAVRQALQKKHLVHANSCWSVTHGKVDEILQSPSKEHWGKMKELSNHMESYQEVLPVSILDIVSMAEHWVDIASAVPPDGLFLKTLGQHLKAIAEKEDVDITIRLLFASVNGNPFDCDAFLEELKTYIPDTCQSIKLWIGTYRQNNSWSNAKIIAVDGHQLFTGGIDMCEKDHLKADPVHDVGVTLEGRAAMDGHIYLNKIWKWIANTHGSFNAWRLWPDSPSRSTPNENLQCRVVNWPTGATDFLKPYPPMFEHEHDESDNLEFAKGTGQSPMITIGRYGSLHEEAAADEANPSDTAVLEMLKVAEKSIKISVQDIGPLTLPDSDPRKPVPGGVWPSDVLEILATAVEARNVELQIVVSMPFAASGGSKDWKNGFHGSGWTCADVAAELTNTIMKHSPSLTADDILTIFERVQITYIRAESGATTWPKGAKFGNNANLIIVDDTCFYIGSQQINVKGLADWGVIVDSEVQAQMLITDYWSPMWNESYDPADCSPSEVMQSLKVVQNEGGEEKPSSSELQLANQVKRAARRGHGQCLLLCVQTAEKMEEDGGDAYVEATIYQGQELKKSKVKVAGPLKSCCKEIKQTTCWNDMLLFEGIDNPEDCHLVVKLIQPDRGSLSPQADEIFAEHKIKLDMVNNRVFQDRKKEFKLGAKKGETAQLNYALCNFGAWGEEGRDPTISMDKTNAMTNALTA